MNEFTKKDTDGRHAFPWMMNNNCEIFTCEMWSWVIITLTSHFIRCRSLLFVYNAREGKSENKQKNKNKTKWNPCTKQLKQNNRNRTSVSSRRTKNGTEKRSSAITMFYDPNRFLKIGNYNYTVALFWFSKSFVASKSYNLYEKFKFQLRRFDLSSQCPYRA